MGWPRLVLPPLTQPAALLRLGGAVLANTWPRGSGCGMKLTRQLTGPTVRWLDCARIRTYILAAATEVVGTVG